MNQTATALNRRSQPYSCHHVNAPARPDKPCGYFVTCRPAGQPPLLGLVLGLVAIPAVPPAFASQSTGGVGVPMTVVYHCRAHADPSARGTATRLVLRHCQGYPRPGNVSPASRTRRVLPSASAMEYTTRDLGSFEARHQGRRHQLLTVYSWKASPARSKDTRRPAKPRTGFPAPPP